MSRPSRLIVMERYVPKNPVWLTADLPKQVLGKPVTYLWKHMLSPGDYRHPATGEAFAIDASLIQHLVSTSKALAESTGMLPYIPTTHAKPADAKDNLGHVVALDIQDGQLWGLHQLVGEEAVQIAAANKSSVFIRDDYTDHAGKTWKRVLDHNAIVPNPVLSLGGFLAASASGPACIPATGGQYLAADSETSSSTETPMIKEIAKMLGLPETATEAEILKALAEKLKPTEETPMNQDKPAADPAKPGEPSVTELQAALAAANAELSRLKTPALSADPTFVSMRRDLERSKVEHAVLSKRITPATADAIRKIIDDAKSGLPLSADAQGKSFTTVVIELIESATRTPPEGEKSGPQTTEKNVALSREVPGEKPNPNAPMTPERKAELLSLTDTGRAVLAATKK